MSLNHIINKSSDNIPEWANLTIKSLNVKDGINASQISNIHIENGTPAFEESIFYNGYNWEFKHINDLAIDAEFIRTILVSSDPPLDNQIMQYNQGINEIVFSNDITTNSIISNTVIIDNTIFVSSKESLNQFKNISNPSDITYDIPSGYALYFTKIVDLEGDRIICDGNVNLTGNSSGTAGIKSTGLSLVVPLITCNTILNNSSLNINNLNITCDNLGIGTIGTAFNLTGNGTNILNIFNSEIINAVFGEIIDYSIVMFNVIRFTNTHSIKFNNSYNEELEQSNTFYNIMINNCGFFPPINEPAILIPSTCIISTFMKTIYSSFVLTGTSIGFDIDDSTLSFLNPASFVLDTLSFQGSLLTSTPVSGMTFNDKPPLWTNNTGNIINTAEVGELIMINNTSDTIIANTSDYFIFEGIGVAGAFNQRFEINEYNSKQYLTYVGGIKQIAQVKMTSAADTGNNNVVSLALIKNSDVVADSIGKSTANGAGKAEHLSSFAVIEIEEGDIFTVGYRNHTGANDILVENLHLLIL